MTKIPWFLSLFFALLALWSLTRSSAKIHKTLGFSLAIIDGATSAIKLKTIHLFKVSFKNKNVFFIVLFTLATIIQKLL